MEIQILTPEKNVVSDSADEVYAVGPKGEFGVLPGHAHYVTPLATGRLFYRSGGERHTYVVQGGYLEVVGEKVLVVADEVESSEEIDRAASEKHLHELEKKLGTDTLPPDEFAQLLQQRDCELARLQATH
jgi:F-type H+-transporting ATPase subunit epsilon